MPIVLSDYPTEHVMFPEFSSDKNLIRKYPKLESSLAQLFERKSYINFEEHTQKQDVKFFEDEKIRIVFELNHIVKEEDLELLESQGAVIETTHKNLVQASIPICLLQEISDLPVVRYARIPRKPESEMISEGVSTIKANYAQSLGYNGSGVKVAIIDIGFNVSNPEIADNIVEAKSFLSPADITGGGNTQHGTACAEIVVDMAPDVKLYLYNIGTDVEFFNAVDYAISQGVDIISMSLGWYNQPTDGTGDLCDKVNQAYNNGTLFVISAGNSAQRHWEGSFQDNDSDKWHNFMGTDETNEFTAIAGQEIRIYLSWDDWPTSDQDFDLYLLDNSLNIIDYSLSVQSGTQSPTEYIGLYASYTGTYHIVIRNNSATSHVNFDLYIGSHTPEYVVSSSSLLDPAVASGAFTVGATYYGNDNLESFSSHGPTNDGRLKPDVTAPDGVSTSSYGTSNFYGTSASAPHVAGMAALLVSYDSTYTPDELMQIIKSKALDLGDSGPDNSYGYGRVSFEYGTPGLISLDKTSYLPGATVHVTITDADMNLHATDNDTIPASSWMITGITSPPNTVNLTETGPNTGVFTGRINISNVLLSELMVVTYYDLFPAGTIQTSASITCDIIIDQALVSDDRADVASTQNIVFHAKWGHNSSDVVGGSIYVNGTECVTNNTGWINLNVSSPLVGKEIWTITGVNCSGVTNYNQTAPNPSVIWDRINITLTLVDDRINVGDNASITKSGTYAYDGSPFDGTITLNYSTYTHSSPVKKTYTAFSVFGGAYDVTAIGINDVKSVVWDRLVLADKGTVDSRIDVNSQGIAWFKIRSEYDNTFMTSGTVTINGSILATYNPTNSRWEIARTKSSVQRETYYPVSLSWNTYGITSLTDASSNTTSIIWDRVNMSITAIEDRISVGENASITFSGIYAYDSAPFTGSIVLNDTTTKNAVGRFGYTAQSISDSLHGLTVFSCNSVYVIFDKVDVTLTITDTRIDAGSNTTITRSGVYAYDGAAFAGSTLLNNTQIRYDTVGKRSYTTISISDPTYGLTAFTSNIVYCIWDSVTINIAVVDHVINIDENATIYINGAYDYDGTPFDGVITLNYTSFVHSIAGRHGYEASKLSGDSYGIKAISTNDYEHVIWESVTIDIIVADNHINVGENASIVVTGVYDHHRTPYNGIFTLNDTTYEHWTVGRRGYTVKNISGDTYGITKMSTNDEEHVIWDRINIAEGGASHGTTNITQTVNVWFRAIYEYDNKTFDGASGILYVDGSAMTWSYVNKRWERNYTYDSPGIRTFLVSNVSDILYGLRTINNIVGTISITWKEFEVVFDGAVHSVPIDTNSAFSNFVFNPTLRQINLTASGPSGTVGTANITVSKQLAPEGYEFKVYLDGEQYPFTLEENATCYFIHLIYIHSQHQITISIVDLTPPILSVMSPSDGSEVKSSNVEVTWSGSDIASGIGHYEIRLDDTSWIDVGADTSHAFTKVSDGSHTVYVKAVDKAGNTNEAQISFKVNTSLIGGPGWIDDLAVFGTVAAIIMLTLFLVRKRR